MAFFVDVVSEVQQLHDLAAFLAAHRGAEGKSESLAALQAAVAQKIGGGDSPAPASADLLPHLEQLIAHSASLIDNASDDDGFAYWSLALGLTDKQIRDASEQNQLQLVQKVIDAVASASGEQNKPALRLKVLGTGYNYFHYPKVRLAFLKAVLDYAHKTRQTESIVPKFGALEEQLRSCGASPEQQRELYRIANTILKENDCRDAIALQLLRSHLNSFEHDTAVGEAHEEAARAIVLAIHLDSDVQVYHDLLELKTIQALQNDSSRSNVYRLLKLFASEGLPEFKAFVAENPQLLEGWGLSHIECVQKIRLLSLVSLAAKNHTLSYAQIAEKLDISVDDVEDWIIDSIAANLLVAKMDQLKQVVVIQRCAHRTFEQDDWSRLEKKLATWSSNVSQLLANVKATGAIDFAGAHPAASLM